MTEPRRFAFGPLERRGLIAGLNGGQLALLGGGLAVATGLLRAAPGVEGVLGSAVVLLVVTAIAFVPVNSQPVLEWVPAATRRLLFRRSLPDRRGLTSLPQPSAFAGLSFTAVSRVGEPAIGMIADRQCLTAVVAVRGRSFALLDSIDKERRLTAWSTVLAGLSRPSGPVRSLQWVERIVPGDTLGLTRHFEAARAVDHHAPAARSYAALVDEAAPLGQDHECFVALSVQGRDAGALLRELRLLHGQLRAAELDVDHVLSLDELGGMVRSAFDPLLRRARCSVGAAWPVATDNGWSWWRTDEQWHATFWVAEWPRQEVGPDFLSPLLLHTTCQRSVSVIMAPLPPSAGIREVESARTAQAADDQLRERAGFLATARRRREAEGIARREAELSDGHAAYRFSGYLTVSAPSLEALEVACGEVVQAGHQCRVELRRLFGIQDVAFTWTLPLGRGIR